MALKRRIAGALRTGAAVAAALFAAGSELYAAPIAGDPAFTEPAMAVVSRALLSDGSGAAASGAAATVPLAARVTEGAAVAGFRTVAGRPELDVRLSSLTPAIVEEARAAGLEILDVDYRYARLLGYCPGDCLAALSRIPEVTAIHPNYGARSATGDVLSQADVSIRAAEARQLFDVSGRGVRIGMISDTFSDRTTGTFAGQGCQRTFSANGSGANELPELVHVIAEPDDLPGVSFNGIDEGRAMAELVHDLAPDAELYFHTAFTTQSIFVRAIEELVDCGVDIIVDDVIYFSEPIFQDGIVAQAAADAVAQDIPFFSAIGNLGTWGIDEVYRDSDPDVDDEADTPTGSDLHRFGNGTRFAPVTIPPRCGLRMILQWNEPFSGVLGEGASSDLDLYACPSDNPLTCLSSAGSRDPQGCSSGSGRQSGDPIEILDVQNRGADDRTFHIAVEHSCGNEDLRFRVVSFALGCNFPAGYDFDPSVFNKSQAYGHPVGDGVIGTAAIFYQEIDSNGAREGDPDVLDVEAFSSLGGQIPIYFDRDGTPIPGGPALRTNPLITAPDGTNTSFFGLRDADGDGLRNFFGTSAAAPHAAAVAALMLEANPALHAVDVLADLQRTSIDIEAPGFDFLSGSGLIDAVDAVDAAIERTTATPSPPRTPTATATRSLPTATPTPTHFPTDGCPGDCDQNGVVSIDELVRGVRINLGTSELSVCSAGDIDDDGSVSVSELVQAVNANLGAAECSG